MHQVGADLVGRTEHVFGVVGGPVLAAKDDVHKVGSQLRLVLKAFQIVEVL